MGNRIKELLASNRLLRVFGVGQFCHPKLIEIIGLQGDTDAVWLDQEHVGLTIPQIEDATRAGRAVGLPTFVRLAPTDYATVMRPLEAGAEGIMAAQVRSAAETQEIIRWSKFFPIGLRGVNSGGVDGQYGAASMADYMRQANNNTFVAIQIEHIDAVEDVDRIAGVSGVDLLFIGPSDLAQSMEMPGVADHPKVWKAIERVARAAKDHGVHWGILPSNKEHADRCVEMGCKMLSLGMDVWAVHRGVRSFVEEFPKR